MMHLLLSNKEATGDQSHTTHIILGEEQDAIPNTNPPMQLCAANQDFSKSKGSTSTLMHEVLAAPSEGFLVELVLLMARGVKVNKGGH